MPSRLGALLTLTLQSPDLKSNLAPIPHPSNRFCSFSLYSGSRSKEYDSWMSLRRSSVLPRTRSALFSTLMKRLPRTRSLESLETLDRSL